MNTPNPKILYAVEPNSERFFRWLRETSVYLIQLYWELFFTLPVTILSMMFAVIIIGVGVIDIVNHPSLFSPDLLLIGMSLAFLIFGRVREFVWALLICTFIWVVLVSLLLVPIVGADYKVITITAKIALGVVEFIPPCIAALYIDYARHRKP
jgi:hypothetical protein